MENIQNRKRSFDVNKLTHSEAERLTAEIDAKVRGFAAEACEKANKLLNIYGLKSLMQIVYQQIEQEAPEAPIEPPKKKRGRKPKAANL